jgi:hypothetical protein
VLDARQTAITIHEGGHIDEHSHMLTLAWDERPEAEGEDYEGMCQSATPMTHN